MAEAVLRFCPHCDAETPARICPHDGTATLLHQPPAMDLAKVATGSVLAHRYVLEQELGRGGFGAVFAARHTGTGQQVAVKVLSAHHDVAAMKRFFREARATAALKSRYTIRVFDFGQDDDGLIFLAMELLRGTTVHDWLRQRTRTGEALSERETLEIGIAACKSLAEAHGAGLVHRDLKPQNLFRVDTEDGPAIKVLDFGIAKTQDQALTGNHIIGTTTHMSPEQALSQKLDGRSDLYSLGVVLYELVSNSLPFEGDSPVATLVAQIHNQPPSLADRLRVPASMAFLAAVHKALAKDPDDRFESAGQMAEALQALLPEAATATRLAGAVGPGLRLVVDDQRTDLAQAIQDLDETPHGIPATRLVPAPTGLLGGDAAMSAATQEASPPAQPPNTGDLPTTASLDRESVTAMLRPRDTDMSPATVVSAESSAGHKPRASWWPVLGVAGIAAVALAWAVSRGSAPTAESAPTRAAATGAVPAEVSAPAMPPVAAVPPAAPVAVAPIVVVPAAEPAPVAAAPIAAAPTAPPTPNPAATPQRIESPVARQEPPVHKGTGHKPVVKKSGGGALDRDL